MTNYIISYDISENRQRTAIAILLLAAGCQRIQKSVFFAPNFTNDEIRQLKANIQKKIHTTTSINSLFCLPLSKQQALDMTWLGHSDHITQLLQTLHFAIL